MIKKVFIIFILFILGTAIFALQCDSDDCPPVEALLLNLSAIISK